MDDLSLPLLLTGVIAALIGAALGWLLAASRFTALRVERDGLRERLEREEAAADSGRDLALVVAPLREALGRVQTHLGELERARVAAYASLTEQVGSVRDTSEQLRAQTGALVSALRAPQTRGRWGEMQLRRVVEAAGMVQHCDFGEQPTVQGETGTQRPDLVVRLAGGKRVVVDAKVSLAAYLEAAESDDPDLRTPRMRAHARHLRKHVDDLAAKSYWAAFSACPEFVVLFVPGEAFLAPALEHDPALLEDAMRRQVVIATPTTLLAMLRTVGYAWQQEALTDHAREVFDLGRALYDRLSAFGGHVDKLGRSIRRTVEDYNAAVGSLERSVLSPARRLSALGVTDRDLTPACPVEEPVRSLAAAELLTGLGEQDRADEPSLRAVNE